MTKRDLMAPTGQPEPQEGTVVNVMTRDDLRKTVVRVKFHPKTSKTAAINDRRWEFPTAVLATEFIQRVNPPPGLQLGSPRQAQAKLAKLLRVDPKSIAQYHLEVIVEGRGPSTVGELGEVELTTEDDPDIDTFGEPTTTGEEDDTDVDPLDDIANLLEGDDDDN